MMTLLLWIFGLLYLSSNSSGLSTVVYGPQSRELLLLASKIAAREGVDTSLICSSGTEEGCRRLMYGNDYAAAGTDEVGKAKPVFEGDDIQAALSNADGLILINYDNPIESKALETILNACDGNKLSKLVVLSKMGVSKPSAGFGSFGGGGGDAKLLEAEQFIRQTCAQRDLQLSIVRAGILKGGGTGKEDGSDGYGLDASYYTTLFEYIDASVTMAHDKYTLGADCSAGDTESLPNMFMRMQTKSSFEPSPTETNRIVVAGAAVAALLADRPVEFSVGSASAEVPPTMEEWSSIISGLYN